VPCDVECLRCTDLPSVCTECVDGFELFADSCIVPCGELQFRASDGRSATPPSCLTSCILLACALELRIYLIAVEVKVRLAYSISAVVFL